MDPITIASTAFASIGKIFGGVMDWFGGQSKKQAEEYAAQQALQEAGVAGDIELQKGNAAEASAAVAAAASGGGVTGSALDVINSLGAQSMFNARSQAYKGEAEAQAHIYQGKVDQAQGAAGLITGVLSAGGTALSSFAKGADLQRLGAAGAGPKGYGSLSSGGDDGLGLAGMVGG